MSCHLCLKKIPLIKKSHILSNFLYSSLRDTDNAMISFKNSNLSQPTTIYTGVFEEGLLCSNCDNKVIGRYELYASQVIRAQSGMSGINITFFKDNTGVEKYAKLEGIDYKKFKLFLLSIIWRSSISKRDFFKKIKLDPGDEEKLRKMIIEEDPGKPDDFPCVIAIARNSELMNGLIREPSKFAEGYKFLIAGAIYHFYIQKPFPAFVTKSAIQDSNTMCLFFMSDEWIRKSEKEITDQFSDNPFV